MTPFSYNIQTEAIRAIKQFLNAWTRLLAEEKDKQDYKVTTIIEDADPLKVIGRNNR